MSAFQNPLGRFPVEVFEVFERMVEQGDLEVGLFSVSLGQGSAHLHLSEQDVALVGIILTGPGTVETEHGQLDAVDGVDLGSPGRLRVPRPFPPKEPFHKIEKQNLAFGERSPGLSIFEEIARFLLG